MKSIFAYLATAGAVFVATSGAAIASGTFNVPEPGSLALVGVAVAALVWVGRKGKK